MPGVRALSPTLYPYQQEGARFLAERPVAACWDGPGLGKTPQAIAAADLVEARRVLVICPAIARINWLREWKRFSGFRLQRGAQIIDSRAQRVHAASDLVIVSFGLAACRPILEQLRVRRWDVVIIDEAHALKTETAEITRAVYGKCVDGVRGIVENAGYVWLLTGTPLPNHAAEVWTHLRALAPERIDFGDGPLNYEQFRMRFCKTRDGLHGVQVIGNQDVEGFRRALAGFFIRRKVEDVLPDLPPLRFEVVTLPAVEAVHGLEALEDHPDIAMLHDILRRSLAGEDDPGELEIDTVAIATLRRLTALAKAHAVGDMLADELDGGLQQVVVFAQHLEAIKAIAERLKRFGVGVIHGAINARDRQAAIDGFQAEKLRGIVLQLQAGSTAITLTAARDVVFAEASWSPADNLQAAKRCHRIGQRGTVLARFVALASSIDEDVQAVLARKTRAVAELLDEVQG